MFGVWITIECARRINEYIRHTILITIWWIWVYCIFLTFCSSYNLCIIVSNIRSLTLTIMFVINICTDAAEPATKNTIGLSDAKNEFDDPPGYIVGPYPGGGYQPPAGGN